MLWNRYQSTGVSATSVKLNERKYLKSYWKTQFCKIKFDNLLEIQYYLHGVLDE